MLLVVPDHWLHAQACKDIEDSLHADVFSNNILADLHGPHLIHGLLALKTSMLF